jgi:hypothetical protein
MQIEIIKQPGISLNQLIEKSEQGFSVMRSAHAGNTRLYNQVLANAGIQMLLVDNNITGVDTNYMPESIIKAQTPVRIAEDGQMTMRTLVEDPGTGQTRFLDELHSQALSQAFPKTEITLVTDYLRENETVSAAVIQVAIDNEAEICRAMNRKPNDRIGFKSGRLFSRELPHGGTKTNRLLAGTEIKTADILALKDDPRTEAGIVVPNEVDIAINFIVEYLATKKDVQYHISGPDMIVYIKAILPAINAICGLLDGSPLSRQLPEVLTVQLVPGTALAVASTMDDMASTSKLGTDIESLTDFEREINRAKRAFFTGPDSKDNIKRQTFENTIRNSKVNLFSTVIESAIECPQIFDRGKSTIPTATQYDTLSSGGLYVPEIVGDLTMAQLAKLVKDISASIGRSDLP